MAQSVAGSVADSELTLVNKPEGSVIGSGIASAAKSAINGKKDLKRVCLAYSGGLDTTCILIWLIQQGYQVVCFCANVGQEEDFEAARDKALKMGAEKLVIEDVRKEFVEEICFRAVQCNAIFEDRYLLGTSLARPVIARAQMRVAQRENCDYVSHGCTSKGNDQVRFELAFYAIQPDIKIIVPWRDPTFFDTYKGREDLIAFAKKSGVVISQTAKDPWSMDENLAHCSYEAGDLEKVGNEPPTRMWKMTVDPLDAPDVPEDFDLTFEKGIPVKLSYSKAGKNYTPWANKKDDKKPKAEMDTTVTDPLELFLAMNKIGHRNGVGRIDIVENRFIGLKSRGCYDTPGLTMLRLAHVDLEGLVLDREVRALRDQFVTITWSKLLYNGMYFSPEREFIEASVLESQKTVNGTVNMRAYKGNAYVIGRTSESSKLYSEQDASMDTLEGFDAQATTGFIAIQALRLRKYGEAKAEEGISLSRA